MKFEGFYGNPQCKEYLSQALIRQRVPHAFLLSGPTGIGKRTLAEILAKALVCQGEGEAPCGVCGACKKVEKGLHPDIIKIVPEGVSIKVEEIRAIKQDAYLRPNDGARKVYLIEQADAMTQEAQDALLKILEEPPSFTVFILLCYNYGSILPTVLSRCIHLPLAPVSWEQAEPVLARALPETSPEERKARYQACGGVLGAVFNPDLQGGQTLAGERAENIIRALASGNALRILETMVSMEKCKRQELADTLAEAAVYVRDALLSARGVPLLRASAKEDTKLLAQRAGDAGLMRISRAIETARMYCVQNIGVAHVAGYLACEFAQAVGK